MSDDAPAGGAGSTVISRRSFVSAAATTAAGWTVVPRHVLGRGATPPSDLLNIAAVGVGGMGRRNLVNVASQNIVALCDVDWGYADRRLASLDEDVEKQRKQLEQVTAADERRKLLEQIDGARRLRGELLPKAKRYRDYREMLDKQKDIDAVIVATPDHAHAIIALAAMDLGKHVYVQKPLAWSVQECRELAKRATEKKVATQMGNQGHSGDGGRTAIEFIWAGAIGDVREVHVWTNRPLTHWPQGIPRPEPLKTGEADLRWNMPGVMNRLAGALGSYPMPEGLAWDLFLGPAPYVEYHPVYHPMNWRGWVDWGVGAIGDMGAHLIDHPFWALDLGWPTSVETVSTPFNKACYPMATTTYYEFPARGSMPPVKLTWYDGGMMPPCPPELGDVQLKTEGGVLLVGSKGKLLHDTYGNNPRILPQSLHEAAGTPPQKLPRVGTSHELNWVAAAKGQAQASSPFEYAARLTEVMLLGVVALRAGTKIHYDGAAMRVTNSASANDLLRRQYRTGWSLSGG
jgi:predicted dehydrogenase